MVKFLDASKQMRMHKKSFEVLDISSRVTSPLKPYIEEPLALELKPLPSHLKYIYLGESDILPVIVSLALSHE